jgi:hypothetical protein
MKNKIIFYSSVEGIEKTMPIIPSKEYKHQWLKKALDDFNEKDLDISNKNENGKITNVTRCPGILTIKNKGWLLRTWQDIEINFENENYSWKTPMNQKTLSNNITDQQITQHDNNLFFKYMTNWPKNSYDAILKINTPWFADIPKGYLLYQFNPAYHDENRFTSLPGIYSPKYGSAELNIPIIFHLKNEKCLIKAGTPIAQFILFKDEDINFENIYIKENKELDKKQKITAIFNNMSFKKIYNNITNFYK